MTSRISADQASRFIKWFNFNPVSMRVRYLYYLHGKRKPGDYSEKEWSAYLRTLPLVTVRSFLHILWGEIWVRRYLAFRRRLRGEE